MLEFINKTLSKIFGSKTESDLKELLPYVPAVREAFATLTELSNDELRGKTIEFKDKIQAFLAETEATITELNER